MDERPWRLETHEDFDFAKFLDGLTPNAVALVYSSINDILLTKGNQLAGTKWVTALGHGLFEFRIKGSAVLIRIFFTFENERVILLLGGYDKLRAPSTKKQNREISIARSRLK